MEALEAFSEKNKPAFRGGDEYHVVGTLDFSNTYLVYQPEPTEQHTEHIATPPHQTLLGRIADTFNCCGRLTLNLQNWFVGNLQ